MHDLTYFRNNLEAVAARLASRGFTLDVPEFRQLDAERRAALSQSEDLKRNRNVASQEIAKLRRDGADTSSQQSEVREIGDRIATLEESVKEVDERFRHTLASIPNLPDESVPVGRSADENVEVRRMGQPREFSTPPKPHWELGPDLNILDLERAAKITGARFALYIGMGAKLERALTNFMLDIHTREHGYTEVLPPSTLR